MVDAVNRTRVHALHEDLTELSQSVDDLLERTADTARRLRLASSKKPHVVVLGGSFAGLETAQKLRLYARDRVDITVIDQKSYLLFIPGLLTSVLRDRDPAATLHMPTEAALMRDDIRFLLGAVRAIDVERRRVHVEPAERAGAPLRLVPYDYLVIALGNRLAYDAIPGFAEHGHALTDTYHANRLRHFLHHRYRGGPVLIGSARFHQGAALDWIPRSYAACEGPATETIFTLGEWLGGRMRHGSAPITFFTPGATFAAEIGARGAKKLVSMANDKGYRFLANTVDIKRVTADGVVFGDGREAEAELAILFPDWVPHTFLRGLGISDDQGFVITDHRMRNPQYPEVLAVGDAAAASVPKLGYLAHLEADVAAWQIAVETGARAPREDALRFSPLVDCLAVVGAHMGLFVRTDVWYGGNTEVAKGGPVPALLKALYRRSFLMTAGHVPNWSITLANLLGDHLSLNLLPSRASSKSSSG